MDTQALAARYAGIQENEALYARKCASENERKFYIVSLVTGDFQMAVCAMYLEKDFGKARAWFSNSAIALEYDFLKYGSDIYYSTRTFCFMVLSDDSRVIRRYMDLHHPIYNGLGLATGFGKAIQAVLKNDGAGLEQAIAMIAKNTQKKSWEKHFAGAVPAFTGLLQKDKALVEKGILELLAAHKKQQQPVIVADYFNIEATTLAKLALRQGLEVNIDNPLLPKEMLPVQECASYPGYEFFKEIGY